MKHNGGKSSIISATTGEGPGMATTEPSFPASAGARQRIFKRFCASAAPMRSNARGKYPHGRSEKWSITGPCLRSTKSFACSMVYWASPMVSTGSTHQPFSIELTAARIGPRSTLSSTSNGCWCLEYSSNSAANHSGSPIGIALRRARSSEAGITNGISSNSSLASERSGRRSSIRLTFPTRNTRPDGVIEPERLTRLISIVSSRYSFSSKSSWRNSFRRLTGSVTPLCPHHLTLDTLTEIPNPS